MSIVRPVLGLSLAVVAGCSMFDRDNRRTLELLDRELAPASTGTRLALAPLALPLGVGALVADAVVVHPTCSLDDAWLDTRDLLWRSRDESALRRALFVPLAVLATPVVFAGDWVGRCLLPLGEREPDAEPVRSGSRPAPVASQPTSQPTRAAGDRQ